VEEWLEQDCEVDEHTRDKERDCSSSQQLDIGRLLERMEVGKGQMLSCTPRKTHAAHAEGSMQRPIGDIVYHMNEGFAEEGEEARGIGVEQLGQVDGRQLETVGRIGVVGEAVVEQNEVVVLRIVVHQIRDLQ
jgi:hypothetical protein